MDRRHDLFVCDIGIQPGREESRPMMQKIKGVVIARPRAGMPGPYGVFLRQRHVDLILDGKAVDRQLCHRYGQPLGKCTAVEP